MLRQALASYAGLVQRHRLAAVVVVVALVGAFAVFLPRLEVNNSEEVFFLKGDPTLKAYQRFREVFQTDEYSLIVFDAPNRWTPEFIGHVRELEETLRGLQHVERVTAITNVRHVEGGSGVIDVGEFLPPGLSASELQAKRARALEHPYYSGIFVSENGEHLGIIVETELIPDEVQYKVELTRKIRETIAQEPYKSWNATAVGAPVLDADVNRIVNSESGLFGIIAFALVGIGFLLVFRSFLGLVLPWSVAIGSVVITFGVMGLCDWPVTLLTPMIPLFLISVGVGSCVFLATHFYDQSYQGQSVGSSITGAFRLAGPACLVASITTAAALFSFASSRIAPVMQVGVATGIGLVAAFVLTFLLTPVFFGVYRRPPRSERRQRMIAGRLEVLERVCGFVERHSKGILYGSLGILVAALAGVAQLETDYYYLGNFKEETRIWQDFKHADEALPVSASIEVLARGPGMDAFKSPERLRKLDELAGRIENGAELPVELYSLADLVKEINQAVHGGDKAYYRIPDSRAAVSQELVLFESTGHDEVTELVSRDYDVARLTVRMPNRPQSDYQPVIGRIRQASDEVFGSGPDSVSVSATGLVPLWLKINEYLASSQIKSLSIAFVVIAVIMMAIFGSVFLGVVMAAANGFVIAVVLGLMGWLGIYLDPYTILLSTIALGILDDDTIHFVKHSRDRVIDGLGINDAVRSAYRQAGQAIMYTTVVLVVSFSSYVLSSVASLTKLGVLVAFVVALGLAMEFLLTPALLLVLGERRLARSSAGAQGPVASRSS